ncbi:MAG: YitT family protein [Clostridiales bacterium]|mgnify:FL=1|nr:YitT family protein [Clostridiales bacterium]
MSAYSRRSDFMNYIYLIIGTIFIAIAVNLVYEPMGMVTGGVTGIGIVVKYFTEGLIEGGIPVWLTNVVLNIPLFIAGYLIKGVNFIKQSLLGSISLTIALYLIPIVNVVDNEFFLASVFGGVISGIGMGMVISASGSTGGTDLLGLIIHHFLPHQNVPRIIGIVDGIIVVAGAIVFGVKTTLYAVVALYITAKFSDNILEGLKFAKVAYIISDYYEEIGDTIMKDLDRGVTGIYAEGMYTKRDKKMLYCVVSKKEITQLIKLVSQIDPKAFVIVSDAREVMGEGFIEYGQES